MLKEFKLNFACKTNKYGFGLLYCLMKRNIKLNSILAFFSLLKSLPDYFREKYLISNPPCKNYYFSLFSLN